ncbi:MAG: ATP-binding protein [Polyangiales bacterium]
MLAGIYYRLVDWQRLAQHARPGEGPYFLNAIVASVVILIVVDPLRAEAEARISRFFFGERYDFERAVAEIRNRLAHTLELDTLGRELMDGLESSRRVTDATLWLIDADRRMLEPVARLGNESVVRMELAAQRGLVDYLRVMGFAVRDQIERERDDRTELGETPEAEALAEVSRAVGDLGGGVVLPLRSDGGDLLGVLAVRDDRVRDAFSTEEVQILRALSAQVAIVLENSRLHARIKERDRLAALGEMAAGMAHEIRNPLGGIKAAAQFLEAGIAPPEQQREFLGIIVEEVGRLDRVVSSVLDYARPYRGNPSVVDVNDAVERTVKVLHNDLPSGVALAFEPGESVPAVRVDAEHLRQVLLNLVRNAADAMSGVGAVTVRTLGRGTATGSSPGEERVGGATAEILVRDTGPGIDPAVRRNLFIPFFTTKAKGTGLGLAISQRLIESAGGRIEIRSSGPRGTTFAVVLPAAGGTVTAPSLPPPAPPPGVPSLHG